MNRQISKWNRVSWRPNQHGVSLIELMVVIVIIGMLAAIAYPSYQGFVIRSNRSAAKSVLLDVAQRQEQFFAENKRYAANLTDLGYTADGFMVNSQGDPVAAGADDRKYSITLTDTANMTFTGNAAPQLQQAAHDAACGTLTLAHDGMRDNTGAADNCW